MVIDFAATFSNLRWGLRKSAGYVALYCAYAVARALLLASTGGVSREPIPVSLLLLLYVCGGLLAGAIVGFGRPALRSLPGAIVVGALAAAPVVAGVLHLDALTSGVPARAFSVKLAIAALFLGGGGGSVLWFRDRARRGPST